MKHLLFLLCSFFCLSNVNGQSSPDWNNIIETDNVRNFVGHLHQSGKTLNDCFNIDGADYNLLSYAIKLESKDILYHLLFDENIDLANICSDKTILMYAVKYGNTELVKAIVKEGADIHQKSNRGKTALDYAKKYEKNNIYGYLNSVK